MIFEVEFNNLILNKDNGYILQDLDIGSVDARLASELAYNRDGGFIFNSKWDVRTISFEVACVANDSITFFERVRALRSAFAAQEAKPLIIRYWDGSERSIDVFPTLIPVNNHETSAPQDTVFEVELVAPQPYFVDKDSGVIEETLTLVQSSGIDLPTDLPASFASGGNNNRFVFNNDGDTTAKLKVEFSGPVINPTLLNSSTGEILQIEKTLDANEVITIEYTAEGRVVENQSGVSQEEFFNGSTNALFIPKGSNTFLFSASTFDANASCTLYLTKKLIS